MNLGPEVPAEAKVVVEDERSRQHVAHDVDDDDEHCELSATPETTHIDHLFVFVVSNQHLHLPPYHQKLNFPQNKSDKQVRHLWKQLSSIARKFQTDEN